MFLASLHGDRFPAAGSAAPETRVDQRRPQQSRRSSTPWCLKKRSSFGGRGKRLLDRAAGSASYDTGMRRYSPDLSDQPAPSRLKTLRGHLQGRMSPAGPDIRDCRWQVDVNCRAAA